MTPQQFVQKWSKIHVKETSAAQSHFNDIYTLPNALMAIIVTLDNTRPMKPNGRLKHTHRFA